MWALTNPGIAIYLFRRQLQDLEKSYISAANGFPSLLRDFIDNKFAKVDLNKKQVKFRNGGPRRNSWSGGSVIHLCHLSKGENDLAGFEGQEIHVLVMDEVCDFTQKEFEFLRSRMRLGAWKPPEDSPFNIKDYFPRILMCTNPGGRGHQFFKSGWVDLGEPYKTYQMDDENGGMRRMYISSRVYDNRILMENDPHYIAKLKSSADKSRVKALLYGDWNISENGIVADSWSYDYNVIPPFDIPSNWYVDRCFDWGSSSPYATIYFAESNGESVELKDGRRVVFPRGTIFAIQEHYGAKPGEQNTGLRISDIEIGKRMKEFEDINLEGVNIHPGPADDTIWGRSNKDKAVIDDMMLGYFGREVYDPNQLFKEFRRGKGTRKEGFALIRNMLESAHDFFTGTMERPGLFIFSNCKNIIATVPTLPRNPKDPDDSDPRGEDHLADVIRYKLLSKKQDFQVITASVF